MAEVTGGWRKLHSESFIICTLHRILSELPNEEDEVARTL